MVKLTPKNWTPTTPQDEPTSKVQAMLRSFIETQQFQMMILVLILVNAVFLGIETMPFISRQTLTILHTIDTILVIIFIVEIGLRMLAYRWAFFKNGWNLFDLVVIGISVLAISSGFSALRAFRVLRVLHLITIMPKMRVVVRSLLESIPGITSVGIVVVLVVYVFAVVAANLYGPDHPALFGGVLVAMYTLFQVLTLEGWADIAGEVAQTHPNSWLFFVSFVLIGVFTMLNLFVAILVRVVDEDAEAQRDQNQREHNAAILAEVTALRTEMQQLRESVEDDSSNVSKN